MKVYRTDEFTDTGVYLFRHQARCGDALHTHNFTELVYIAEGACEQTVDGALFRASAGDFILIEEGQTHAFRALGEGFTYVNLILSREFLALYADDPLFCRSDTEEKRAAITLFGGERELAVRLLDFIAAELLGARYASLSAVGGTVRTLLSLFYRRLKEGTEERGAHGRFDALLSEIEERLEEGLSLSLLAASVGYDEAYFSRAFKREIGKSPMAYVTERRVLRAAALLSGTELPIAEIGRRSGFEDRSVMARAFRRVLGKSPSDIRKG